MTLSKSLRKEAAALSRTSGESFCTKLARLYCPALPAASLANRVMAAQSDGAWSTWLGPSFSYHDWDRLSIDRDMQNFWPPSPLREPFRSLFARAPDVTLDLFRKISNHAMAAWRQLHVHLHDSPGKPIPLTISFPWGDQNFWGGDAEYLWHRGLRGPKPLASAFMALDDWCFAELSRGRKVEELIEQIVKGNDCIGVLGTAVTLALHTESVSEAVFPLVTAQRLWSADHQRWADDIGSSSTALMGFRDKSDLPHIVAIKEANSRPVRQKELRWLAPRYIFDQTFSQRTKAAILDFKSNLPFRIEQHQNDAAARDYYLKQALEYAELADDKNYQAYKPAEEPDKVAIVHVSPSASSPENLEIAQRARLTLQEGSLWTWASKSFEAGKLDTNVPIAKAIEAAKELDSPTLYAASPSDEVSMRRGAVAATAAMVLTHRQGLSQPDLDWARDVVERARTSPEERNGWWSAQSIISWHHGIFAAKALASEIRAKTGPGDAASSLLALVTHPLDSVSLAAVAEAQKLWPFDPKLAWAALQLALLLCHIQPSSPDKPRLPNSPTHSLETVDAALKAALEGYKDTSTWGALKLPPPAWVKVSKKAVASGSYTTEDYDEDDVVSPTETWGDSPVYWHSQYAAQILPLVPTAEVIASGAREDFLTFIRSVLAWTNEKNAPPWVKPGRRDRDSTRIMEWTTALGHKIGRLSGLLPLATTKADFLDPIFSLPDEPCWALLSPCVETFVCAYVYDAAAMPPDAVSFLKLCLERLLKSSSFDRNAYRPGRFSGYNEPSLVQSLIFVSVENAPAAARYVNGDWSTIGTIMPIIDRFIREAGWIASLMGSFLTLCERAKASYPASTFAEQILSVIGGGANTLAGWHGTLLPARIAGLVQHFAERDTPMPPLLAQSLLRILDLLVDMGDRRSAALQLSESFREVRIG